MQNRQEIFDANRRMEDQIGDQVRNIIQQQEAQIIALQARIEQLAAAAQQAQQRIQQQQIPLTNQKHFTLTSEQFLNCINKLRCFNGKDECTVQEFINIVERTLLLCPEVAGLRDYALSIIINDKIQGEAKRCIQRLGANAETRWDEVKQELKLHFRPRQDYVGLLNECRSLRVSTLRELFEIVKEINYKLNELYEFDDEKPPTYHPSNNDKYLVDIVSSKIHDFLRGNIPENSTLIEIYNKFDKLKLLDNENAVDFKSKKNKTNLNKSHGYYNHKTNNPSCNKTNRSNVIQSNSNDNTNKNTSNQNNPSHNRESNQRNNFQRNNNFNYRNNYNRNFNNSGRFNYRSSNPNFNQPRQNSEQIRNNSTPEPMEIGNLNQYQDVNFQNEPRNQESP